MASSDSNNGMFQQQQPSGNTNNHSPNNHRHYHDGSAKFGGYELSSVDCFDISQTNKAFLGTIKRGKVITLHYNAIVAFLSFYIYLSICLSIYAFSNEFNNIKPSRHSWGFFLFILIESSNTKLFWWCWFMKSKQTIGFLSLCLILSTHHLCFSLSMT